MKNPPEGKEVRSLRASPAIFLLALPALAQRPSMPAAPMRPVIDEGYDIKVIEDYRWLACCRS